MGWFSTKKSQGAEATNRAAIMVLEKIIRRLATKLTTAEGELGRVKHGLAELGQDRQDLLIKVSRIEGALGIGLSAPDSDSPDTQEGSITFQQRREAEEAERLALEQLGTGGSAQALVLEVETEIETEKEE